MHVENLDHLNLSVESLDVTVEWYPRVFGFRLVEEAVSDGVRWGVIRSGEALPNAWTASRRQRARYNNLTLSLHPFVDGNTRVAFFATDVFLRLNGWRFEVDARPTHSWLAGLLEAGECDLKRLDARIRSSVKRI